MNFQRLISPPLKLLYCLILGLSLVANQTQAQSLSSEGLRLSADNISRDYDTKLVTLEGNVEVAVADQVFKADKAILNLVDKSILAEGNVVLVTGDTVIEGSSMNYNYQTKLGKIKNGFVQNGAVVFEGKQVEKTGENTYVADDAKYTSCTNCPASWSFWGQRIDAEMGGYAYIKYPVLRVLNFPIFILPRLLVPLKSDRQSGLLVPSLDFSQRGGLAISQSYFWAISRSQDMTFTFKKFEKRGTKAQIEHRQVINENSQSYTYAGYMRDEGYTVRGDNSNEVFEVDRSFLIYKQYHQLPEGYIHRVNLNYLSDLRYIRDFSEDLIGHGDPSLENSTSITQNTENTHRSAEVMFHLNLLKNENAFSDQGDAFSRNDNAVHKWPELRYSITESQLSDTNIFYKMELNYTHFARRDRSYDELPSSVDSNFDPDRDFIRTGHRLIFNPEFSYPIKIANFFNITPRIKYNESQYRFTPTASIPNDQYKQNASRRYVETDLEMSTVFTRIYQFDNNDRLKHEVIPEITYSEIPWIERPNHLFFGNYEDLAYSRSTEGISQEDLDYATANGQKPGLQFDYRDRLFDKRLVTFALSNHFVQKTFQDGLSSYKKLATFRLSQSYDLNEAERTNPEPWSAVSSLLDIRLPKFETHTITEYYPYADVTNWSSRVRFMSAYGNYLQFVYSFKEYINDENEPTGTKNENLGVGLGFKTKYFDLSGITNFSLITDSLESWEYVASIKPPGDCWSLRVGQKKIIGSDTIFSLNLNFDFGGT